MSVTISANMIITNKEIELHEEEYQPIQFVRSQIKKHFLSTRLI